ncbi:PTS transporter subunit EIIC [Lactobacillus sp. DCY120]|uniref:PTS transporter subunit EIIC n=1 Tax=Bombilactobacillus apium TaxID=2675299 RepID=A0A850R642_9LACO|nr:PTS transporter subunit EIIC [Bombilactobacillus apium]
MKTPRKLDGDFFERIAVRYEDLSSTRQLVVDFITRHQDIEYLKIKTIIDALFAAATTAFLIGITEPIEFTFLFVAPVLYAVHAVLAELTLAVTSALGASFLTPTGHGSINYLIYGALQGSRTCWWLLPIVGIFYFIVYYFVFRFVILKFDFLAPGRESKGTEITLHGKKETRQKLGVQTLKAAPASAMV